MIDNQQPAEEVREIKRMLRGVMNGPVSASMREKGLAYKVNFGVELPRLREMATELPHTYNLAAALWKEDIRECRLLATMLMPPAEFDEELGELWVEQMRFLEEAEMAAMHLFAHTPWASQKAFEWMAAERELTQICGYLLLARLFMAGAELSDRDEAEYLDHTATALKSSSTVLQRAAGKTLTKYMNLGPDREEAAENMLQSLADAADSADSPS